MPAEGGSDFSNDTCTDADGVDFPASAVLQIRYENGKWSETLQEEFLTAFVLVPRSAESLFILYSIRFCSKLGSSRYSCNAPARDTGA